ncbi:MAG: TerB family tellurite resistance protein [Planctomycetota bacterium]
MIIFGTRGITTTRGRGQFYCPQCSGDKDFVLKRLRSFFHIYFIPLLPISGKTEFLRCKGCRQDFRTEVLQMDPRVAAIALAEQFQRALRRTISAVVMADGKIDDAEIATAREIVAQVVGLELTPDEVVSELEEATSIGHDAVLADLTDLGPQINDQGKELIVRAAMSIASADGSFDDEERELVGKVAGALGMSPAHVRGLMAESVDEIEAGLTPA